MNWGRQGALGMLVAVVLWTAAPLIACVPGLVETKAKHNCCGAMMQDCELMIGGSCCELSPSHNTAALISTFAPEHEQLSAIVVRATYLPMLVHSGAKHQTLHEIPPPDHSPGGISILRI
jgi:hypothetical protein